MNPVLDEHLTYLSDGVRVRQFQQAITNTVRGGELVADVGCGFGILGLMCLRAGAARVWGIDKTSAIEIARQTLANAGFADRYVCIHGRSVAISLPERVDLVVCDHIGHFGLDYGILFSLPDARRRFLKPGGKIIPEKIRMSIAAVASERCELAARAWRTDSIPVDYRWVDDLAVNTRHPLDIALTDIVSHAAILGEVDLYREQPELLSYRAELEMTRSAAINGLAGWYDAELSEGVWVTNSPLKAEVMKRAPAFFPIQQPANLLAGDRISVTVSLRPNDGLMNWRIAIPRLGVRFAHSTFKSWILPSGLIEDTSTNTPALSSKGRARQRILALCDGNHSVEEIRREILHEQDALGLQDDELLRLVAETIEHDVR